MKDGGDLGAAREACPGGVLSAFGQPMTDDSQPPVQQAFRVPKAPLLDPSNAFPIFVSLCHFRGWLGVLSSVPRGGSDSAVSGCKDVS